MKDKHTMDESEILIITQNWIESSQSFLEENIEPVRAKAMRYYRGENPDNLPLVDGRSKVVSTDVRDVIEWVLPDLLRVFTSGDKYVSIEPHGEEDAESAELAEEWVNYVLMRANPGFMNTYTWIKDALLEKLACQKVAWVTETTPEEVTLEGLTDEDLGLLEEAEDFEIQELEQTVVQLPDPLTGVRMDVKVYTVTGIQYKEEADIIEECLPNEEVLFTEEAKSIPHNCRFVGHKTEKTLSELRQMGFDVPDDLQGPELGAGASGTGEQELERKIEPTDAQDSALDIDPSQRLVWVYELYGQIDIDRDGISEWCMITRVGDTILQQEKVKSAPIYTICPVPQPHRAVGWSLADLIMDLQENLTALNRAIHDHIYLSSSPRSELVTSGVTGDTVDDLLDNRIGGHVRVKHAGTIVPLMTKPMEPGVFGMLEHWQAVRENRTGVTRYNQGMDADSLNKTASGIYQIMSKAASRVELIARIFAETGFKDKVRGILELSVDYPEYLGERTLRLAGRTLQISAEALKGRYDYVVNPGIGMGNKDQMLQHLMTLLNVYERMYTVGLGPGQSEKSLVTIKNIFNATTELVKNMGYRNTGEFITDPDDPQAEREPVQEPPPNPEMIKIQGEQDLAQQKMQFEAQQAEADQQLEAQKMALEQQKQQLQAQNDAGERELREKELAIKDAELALKEREIALEEYRVGGELRNEAQKIAAEGREKSQPAPAPAQPAAPKMPDVHIHTGGGKRRLNVVRDEAGDIAGGEIEDLEQGE